MNNYLKKKIIAVFIAFVALAVMSCSQQQQQVKNTNANETGWLIKNADIYDGSGDANYQADIRIKNGVISEIAKELEAREGEKIWDASGLVLSPGFIDPHSHGDSKIMKKPAAASLLAQGITTITGGLDGSLSKFGDPFVSVADNMAYFEAHPAAVNIGFFAPFSNYRHEVMGDDYKRPATEEEIVKMKKLLVRDMAAGAYGFSTGLEYEPELYSTTEEVIALAKVAGEFGGKYSSHIRSEDVAVTSAFDEVINIAREAQIPANISHIKLAMSSLFGDSTEFIEKLDAARAEGLDITADIYPYDGWQSNLAILIPSRDFKDRNAAEFALNSIAAPSTIIFTRYERDPSFIGKTLEQVAKEKNADPVDLMMNLLQTAEKDGKTISIIGRNIGEEDIENFMKWPYTAICTDGGIDDRHPRGQGTFPRVLGRYVRENSILSLPEAIRKMTSLPAHNLGITDRGLIKTGYVADLTVFDAATIIDEATFSNPIIYSTGIKGVWVSGELVWENDADTGVRPGKVIRRQ